MIKIHSNVHQLCHYAESYGKAGDEFIELFSGCCNDTLKMGIIIAELRRCIIIVL